jgi:hypothetical protein
MGQYDIEPMATEILRIHDALMLADRTGRLKRKT